MGVSLTVNQLASEGFVVMVIPETLNKTNLGDLQVGDSVNIEYDLLVKAVQQQLSHILTTRAQTTDEIIA